MASLFPVVIVIDTYTSIKSDKLVEIEIPDELDCQDPHCSAADHLQARDNFLLDVLIPMIEASYAAKMEFDANMKWGSSLRILYRLGKPSTLHIQKMFSVPFR